jgi:hypothetical protein
MKEIGGPAGFPPRRPGLKPGSGHVRFCDGLKWRWGRFSPRISVSPANIQSIYFSTIIFTITRGWHNRPGVAAVPIASQPPPPHKQNWRSHRGGPSSNPGLVMWDFVMDKSGAGAVFLRELRFPLPIYIPSTSPQSSSLSPEAGTIGQEWPQCQ